MHQGAKLAGVQPSTASYSAAIAASGLGGISKTSDAGKDRAHCNFARRKTRGHPGHIQRVCDNQSSKAHFLSQQVSQYFVGKRGGQISFGSNDGTERWPVITALAPAAIAARKGTSSTCSSRLRSASARGRSKCESVLVSP